MGIKVAKFGGSSVADAAQIRKIKDIVSSDNDRRYVVVSAPGKRFDKDNKITDLLYSCHSSRENNLPYDELFSIVAERFIAIEKDLEVNVSAEKELNEIKENIDAGREVDYIVSRGEYLNGMIIAAYLGIEFIDAEDCVSFDERGRFLEEETNVKLRSKLAKHPRALVPGFYGTDPDGEIKTFSRGGSDISGALVAKAVEADLYENWTDVSGFLIADPRVVKNPKPIKTISYKELRELSYMGATVLHEDAVFPVRVSGIPINIRNTNVPEDEGTIITAEPAKADLTEQIITGIAGSKDFLVIAIYKNRLSSERGFVRKLAGILEDKDIVLEHLPSGIDTISVVVSKSALGHKLQEVLEAVEIQLQPDSIEVFEDMALIATVGYGMAARPGTSAKLFSALANAGINIRMIDQGSSEMNIIVGVSNKEFEKAINAIYREFVK
ncbi:MAG: aspartate kinase [Anaerovoracaceae bacterium]